MKVTQAQLDALYKVYQRWQNKTEYDIMPMDFEIVPDEDYPKGDYIGVWVANKSLYLGIESDGHTHS